MSDRSSVGLTLRRIAAGIRLVGLAWMVALSLLAITRDAVQRPGLVWLLIAVATAWAAVTALAQVRQHDADPWWVTIGDAALATTALFAPEWGGTNDLIYGGYPAITVAVGAVTARRRGWLVAAVLSLATLVRLQVADFVDVLSGLSQLISYFIVAGIVGWAAHVIYVADRDRRAAEAGQARAEERAQVAAHLHDSVLQTLALIQRDPDDGERVSMLARSQERELRDWLYGPSGEIQPGLAEAVRKMAAEVDEMYRVPIEAVVVGDAPVNETTAALLAAGKEAVVNAAKHAGKGASVYLEATTERARLFVRDRGIGFDVNAVPGDRHGIRQSIRERIERVGGSATVESTPGQGTEVRLEVPL